MADVMLTKDEMLAALGTDTVLLDVRDIDEWIGDSSSPYGRDYAPRKGRIPGAVNLREIFTFLATSTAEGLSELKGTFAQHFGAVGLSGKETAVFYEDALNSGYGQSCRGDRKSVV